MKIIVFGPTGGTGVEVVERSLQSGDQVTAFVRDEKKQTSQHENLTVVTGDVYDAQSVRQAIKGKDAVVCVLGTGNRYSKSDVRAIGTQNIIEGMQAENVKRLVVVSFMGAGESWSNMPGFMKPLMKTLLKNRLADHNGQEELIRLSNLDWTLVRPSRLTNKSFTGKFISGEDIQGKSMSICRADVADYAVRMLRRDSFIGKSISVTN